MSYHTERNFAVIMAGGVGTRLWPFSRANYPKQFHDLLNEGESFLQATVKRLLPLCPMSNIYIVSNQHYYDIIKAQLPELKDEQILLEPVKRNTAPCIAYASYKIAKKHPEANLLVTPADQVVRDATLFQETAQTALDFTAQNEVLLTFGIRPTRPDTGYGYIQFGEGEGQLRKVRSFLEKPDLEHATKFVESGEFVWNAGIFVWNAESIKTAFAEHLPDLADIFQEIEPAFYTEQEAAAVKKAYSLCKNISIDYGIMEKADNVQVILSSFDWSDLGTWKSLYENSQKDANQNVLSGEVLTYDTSNSIIKTPKNKLVVVQGLDNFIVAEYDGVLLICKKDEEQRVREFVAEAKNKGKKFI